MIRAEVHAENTNEEHLVHFEESDDFSDAGSLITQAPQSQSIHATINALSSWVSAIQPRESWYLAGWEFRRFPHRLSGRSRGGRQRHLITMLREIGGSKRYTYAHEGHTHGARSSQQIGHACSWNV